MKAFFRSIALSLQMFSVIPMPRVEWKKENMRYALVWLPLVGALIGLLMWAWLLICDALSFGNILFAAGLTLLPILLSGGIHMDGFCDTVDALMSRKEPQRKREILKDPHVGAFAVIFTAAYLLLFFARCTELPRTWEAVCALGVHQVFSRALGALSSAAFPSASKEGLQRTFRDAASDKVLWLVAVWAVLCAAALCVLSPIGGAVCAVVFLLCLWCLFRMSKKQFGGMTGDLAGFGIVLSGLLMLFFHIIVEKAVAL